jgi:large subunit ribosomal protein L25
VSGERYQLTVHARDDSERGSRYARRVRREGLVPGVMYGKGHTRAIAVHERELRAALTGPSGLNAIVDVVLDGQTTPHHAVLKEYQQHPIRGTITHFDFHEVRLDQPIQAVVTVQLVGESVGVKAGGVLQQVSREIHVEALPMNVPEHIDADISELEIGDTLRLEDIAAVPDVLFLDDLHETVIATVSAPRVIEEVVEEEVEEGEEVAAAEEAEAAAEAEPSAAEEEQPSEE